MKLISTFIFTLIYLSCAPYVFAYDLYGASIVDKMPSALLFRMGIAGKRPVVTAIQPGSHAEKYGFLEDDVIYRVNNKEVIKSSDLSNFTTDKLSVYVFRKKGRVLLVVDRLAIETEKANRLAADKRKAEEEKRLTEERAAAIAEQQKEEIRQVKQIKSNDEKATYGVSVLPSSGTSTPRNYNQNSYRSRDSSTSQPDSLQRYGYIDSYRSSNPYYLIDSLLSSGALDEAAAMLSQLPSSGEKTKRIKIFYSSGRADLAIKAMGQ